MGRTIRDVIIPAIAHLRQLFPLSMNKVLPLVFLDHPTHSFARTLDCTNISESENYFHSYRFIFKYVYFLHLDIQPPDATTTSDFICDRDLAAWKPAMIDLVAPGSYSLSTLNAYLLHTFDVNTTTTLPVLGCTPSSTPIPIPAPGWHQSPSENMHVITTKYNPINLPNVTFKFNKGKDPKSRKDLFNKTEQQRGHVALGQKIESLTDLDTAVSNLYTLHLYNSD